MFRSGAKNTLHLFSRAGTCMNAANNWVEYALREGSHFLGALLLDISIKRNRVGDVSEITVNDSISIEFTVLSRAKINKRFRGATMFYGKSLAIFNLGRGACNDNASCGIAARTYNNAVMRFRRGYTAMTQEIDISANNGHGRNLSNKVSEESFFFEDGMISLQVFRRNIAVFEIFIGARAEEVGISHLEASCPTIKAALEITPFGKTMSEGDEIIMKRPLVDGGVKCFDFRRTQLIGVERLAACDEKTTAAARLIGRSFDDRYVTCQRRIFADTFDEKLRLRGDRAIFHCVVGVPENGRRILPQMVSVGKINKLECVELGKPLAGQMTGDVVQDLNNPLLLIGHNGADYITKKDSCTTTRKQKGK